MGGTCNTHGRPEKRVQHFEYLKETFDLRVLYVMHGEITKCSEVDLERILCEGNSRE
jgi:hypothetical protein